MKHSIILLIFTSIITFQFNSSYSQNNTPIWLEDYADNENQSSDPSEILETLEKYIQNPLNLNSASEEQLYELQILNDLQIKNLINYRKTYGILISKYELLNINGFDNKTIHSINPYIKIDTVYKYPDFKFPNNFDYLKSELILREKRILENQKGYSDIKNGYLGSKDQLYGRIQIKQANQFKTGLTFEKDAGEQFFKGTQNKGFDFYSAFINLNNFKNINTLIIGDFKTSFGQGLNLWNGFNMNNSSFCTNIRKIETNIKPYTSSNEYNFMRGIASSFLCFKYHIHLYISYLPFDSKISYPNNSQPFFYSKITDGLHNTEEKISNKNNNIETIAGFHIDKQIHNFKYGITGYQSKYKIPYHPNKKIYNQFSVEGDKNKIIGFDYTYYYNPFYLFGELSSSNFSGFSFVQGINAHLTGSISLATIFRYYDKKYYNLHSNSFSANSNNSNEKGYFTGMQWSPFKKITISASRDISIHPWLLYQADAPSFETTHLLQLDININKQTYLYIRYNNKKYQSNNIDSTIYIHQLETINKHQIRIHFENKINNQVTLKNRIDFLQLNKNKLFKGFLIYQDINYKSLKYKFEICTRIALFDTDNYDSRIYTFENSALYNFSSTSHYYQGIYNYFLFKYLFKKNISIWFKISQTHFSNLSKISSDLNEINGNKKTEILIQARFTL